MCTSFQPTIWKLASSVAEKQSAWIEVFLWSTGEDTSLKGTASYQGRTQEGGRCLLKGLHSCMDFDN